MKSRRFAEKKTEKNKEKAAVWLVLALFVVFLLGGCRDADVPTEDPANASAAGSETASAAGTEAGAAAEPGTYQQISQDEAREMMAQDGTQVIVDVRTQEEYEAGHIPGAVCIPNESIGTEQPAELPDYGQIILVYCRSGRRSKEASQKLADMGYINVYEFGGINDWTGEIVTEDSNSGSSEDSSEKQTENENQIENEKQTENENQTDKEDQKMILMIGEEQVPVTWEENESVQALRKLAADAPLAIQMSMYGGFEQVGPIGQSLPRDDKQTTTAAGDIVLYSGNQIVVFYGTNSWDYTRLGHVDLPPKEMEKLLGNGDVSLTLQMED